MTIKLLSEQAISKIAAGEVVERPMSVVKELVENSIDAGATSVNVIFKRGGRSIILVNDNGYGIEKEELPIALCRYATSKLNDENLDQICYLGFRGEALSAISSVSRTSIVSKSQKSANAWKLSVEGGLNIHDVNSGNYQLIPASHPQGTTIEIRDLFYSTPTRVKFLRSEQAENIACIDLIQRFALSCHNISFSLQINDKAPLVYNTKDDDYNSGSDLRVKEVLGSEFLSNATKIKYESEELKIFGYSTIPTYSRLTTAKQKQYCYVNGRVVKDQFLNNVIKGAYYSLLPHDRYPMVVLFIDINPSLIDVNIHPNKTQIRFWQEQKVKGLIFNAIRNSISSTRVSSDIHSKISEVINNNLTQSTIEINDKRSTKGFSSSIYDPKFYNTSIKDTDSDNLIKATNNQLAENNSYIKANPYVSEKNSSINSEKLRSLENLNSKIKQSAENQITEDSFLEKQNISDTSLNLGVALCQINYTYIISQAEDSIVIVDQHAAHERLVLEKIKQDIKSSKKLLSQMLLVPEIIELGVVGAESLVNIADKLESIGIKIERNGITQVILREIPAIPGGIDMIELLSDIANDIDLYQNLIEGKFDEIYGNIACRSSIRAGRKLNIAEMNNLLRMMEITPFSSQCNHGRPTYVKLPLNDLAKIFERA